ncbi:Transposase-like [Oopsacas minuta]|uniref:Transposase-like n=1 Tax=Oopsacas minuta TaxID=111878 RepID=A0AAV7JEZ8_9METZ|nr:Transposase-like [Oopsacas minuta]
MDVKMTRLSIRERSIGMLLAGSSQRTVADTLGVTIRTVKNWNKKQKAGEMLNDKPRSGRPPKLSRVPKIIIRKSIGKRWHSTRKLAKYISTYKRPSNPKLTEVQKSKRVKFCLEHKSWTSLDWERVFFSDESPFELFHPTNSQNDRVWDVSSRNITPVETVKNPPRLMVWGMMSHRGLSELHLISPRHSVNADYYINEILAKCCLPTYKRKKMRGPLTQRKLYRKISDTFFMLDGAPAHTAIKIQKWLSDHLPGFWAKDIWPSNSPDLNPIENLWAIMQAELDKRKPATNLKQLAKILENIWSGISPSILQNLIDGMPNRINSCIELNGEYIGK